MLDRFNVAQKLLIAFGLVLIVVIGLSAFAINRLATMNLATLDIAENWLPGLGAAREVDGLLGKQRATTFRHILTTDDKQMVEVERLLEAQVKDFRAAKERYAKLLATPEERANYEAWTKVMADYDAMAAKVLELSRQNQNDAARDMVLANVKLYADSQMHAAKAVQINAEGAKGASETAAALYSWSRAVMIGAVAAVITLVVAFGLMLRNSIATPIIAMTAAMNRLADKDLSVVIPAQGRTDEVGRMAAAMQTFKDNMIRSEQLEAEQKAAQERNVARGRAVENLTRDFDNAVSRMLGEVSAASHDMEQAAQAMSATAQQTSRQAVLVAAATEEASSSVQTVASAAEELAASIHEIGRQVTQSSQVARLAADEAARTNQTVNGLAESSARIGDVVKLINDIASQTNLLALNATIEAARAGDAGKGFAVVAGEVKHLANQTGRATEEISQQISAVQEATLQAVDAIGGIVKRIEEINQISAAIASAVEEQSAATAEIARNVQQAASGTQEVSANIGGVTQAAEETGSVATTVLTSVQAVNRQADSLRGVVANFLTGVKTA
ncbi:methyl-accepting chemotaxis protein [Paramagnetospirillum caucaseum]|uniref:Methyl-accepting chemotaxis protein n=1 Tax=Paramagnetospirillum caucaseum TaxID=1244869 RepID=M2Z9J1_9PROT|nr:methyl-accepting chemotaxis protein [Paramagnetospirillum caucaseum]EME71070.1 methyl-accepting chemotaxis protein [Paramagnetospirillum caucaseum]